MDKAAALAATERFRKALEARGVMSRQIILFGSYSTGCFSEDSDIDLIVVSDDFIHREYWDTIGLLARAICDVREPIEALPMTPEEWENGDSLLVQCARKGEVVYQA